MTIETIQLGHREPLKIMRAPKARGEKILAAEGWRRCQNQDWWERGNEFAHYNRFSKAWHITEGQK